MAAPFRPRILDILRGYSRSRAAADLGAGVTVGIVALPLAMAFAIASGLKPEAGLCAFIGLQHVDARLRLLIAMAGGQHHAFGHTKFHFAWREVGHQHGELAGELLGCVGAGNAGKDVAGLALARVQRQAQQLG